MVANVPLNQIKDNGDAIRAAALEKEPQKIQAIARYMGRSIDPLKVYQNIFPGKFADIQKDCLTVTSKTRYHSLISPYAKYTESHTVVFKYGSVVFFNFFQDQITKQVNDISQYCTGPIAINFQPTDDHTIKIDPSLFKACVSSKNVTTVREINYQNLAVISRVMGQSVALHHYEGMVDLMLEDFHRLNDIVARTGAFTAMEIDKLFKLVARNNSVLTNVIAEVGLLERSETAWKYPEYDQLWEGLREEFDLHNRFKNLELKLNLIQTNTKFFLEILHNQKSDTLEWIIIILIAVEIVIGICDIIGYKPSFALDKKEKEST